MGKEKVWLNQSKSDKKIKTIFNQKINIYSKDSTNTKISKLTCFIVKKTGQLNSIILEKKTNKLCLKSR